MRFEIYVSVKEVYNYNIFKKSIANKFIPDKILHLILADALLSELYNEKIRRYIGIIGFNPDFSKKKVIEEDDSVKQSRRVPEAMIWQKGESPIRAYKNIHNYILDIYPIVGYFEIFVINLYDLGGQELLKKNGYKTFSLINFPGH